MMKGGVIKVSFPSSRRKEKSLKPVWPKKPEKKK